MIKANRIETAEVLGVGAGVSPAMLARRLAIWHGCQVVVSAGEFGLWWVDGGRVRRVPAVPVAVRNVCGAEDAVLATLGMVMARGGAIEEACRVAVRAVAEQVGKVGVGTVGGLFPCLSPSSVCRIIE